ncbi:M48 family metallopeptidase [Protofrankia symbiont of Coriaria ruscifolia]|uniref:M48 family metallopeptidase n=1 Tax=Protofrankia symbiont of Coriaria ruscifolia TaxID=1306542 RepID=UPI00104169B4|nr:M48 family metallopeptidase [Protofrankia symbiont of Coriaria ruscifolia]
MTEADDVVNIRKLPVDFTEKSRQVADRPERGGRVRLPGLDPDAFRHPLDRRATRTLQRIPGFDRVVAKYIEWGVERVHYVENTASSVKVGPRQLPAIYAILREACAILDVPEPELYVRRGPVDAYTSGHTRPYVVLFTDLLDIMDTDELLAVIAHELGHVKCGHVLYGTMARIVGGAMGAGVARKAGAVVGNVAAFGLGAGLAAWARKAELTADRAAMLAVQDPGPCVRMMMKLAGGATRWLEQMNPDAFLEQARLLDDMAEESKLARFHRLRIRTAGSHPLAVERARYFDEWLHEDEPRKILEGIYAVRAGSRHCLTCATPPRPTENFCATCGTGLTVWTATG